MKLELMNTLRNAFNNEMADTVEIIAFKDYTNDYDPDTGDNTQGGNDMITRASIVLVTEKEVSDSDGSIQVSDINVLIISDEITRAPVINDVCDVNSKMFKVSACRPGAFGESYAVRMSKENG